MYRKLMRLNVLLPITGVVVCLFLLRHFRKKQAEIELDGFEGQVVHAEEYSVNYNIHAFYYAWYGNPMYDEDFYHWNHRFLPHWNEQISNQYATGQRHKPPDDIGSNFYPTLGTYSSYDPVIQKIHMHLFRKAKIGVMVLSWYPPGLADDEGKPSSVESIKELLDSAEYGGIKVCFHIEPYAGRTALSVAANIKYIIDKYGSHGGFYRMRRPRGDNIHMLPLVYVYDSYLIPAHEWKTVLAPDGQHTIRTSPDNDAIVIGLLSKKEDKQKLLEAGFDGFYTYFASSGFTYGSDRANWRQLSDFADNNQLIYIPSVGPGYIDTNIRPWNGASTKSRANGKYYDEGWRAVIDATSAAVVSVTSFNEWHEGTQIEPAAAGKTVGVDRYLGTRQPGNFTYAAYDQSPEQYLALTRRWVERFEDARRVGAGHR